MAQRRTIPIFPLPLVLFPGMKLPLRIFEPRYHQMLKDIMGEDQLFGVTLSLNFENEAELTHIGMTTEVGTLAKVTQFTPEHRGQSHIDTHGMARFRVVTLDVDSHEYLSATVELFEDDVEGDISQVKLDVIRDLYENLMALNHKIQKKPGMLPSLDRLSPEDLSFRIAMAMSQDVMLQQSWLEMRCTARRLLAQKDFLEQATQRLAAISQIRQVFNE